MRTANFRDDLVYPMADMLGIDPLQDFNRDHARAFITAINQRTREGWDAWDFRELNKTEERALRTTWTAGRQFTRADSEGNPDEVYYLVNQIYYQVNPDAPADPPIGTLPTNATYFQVLDPVSRYIAFDQTGQIAIGQVEAVYSEDPGVPGSRPRVWPHGLSERGIELPAAAGPTVWMTFKRRPSKFSSLLYDNAKRYQQGNVVYAGEVDDVTSGQCFRAITATNGNAPSDPAYWALVPMPYTLVEFVKLMAASDIQTDAATKATWQADGLKALQREIDKLVEQGQGFPTYRGGGGNARRPFPPVVYQPVPA